MGRLLHLLVTVMALGQVLCLLPGRARCQDIHFSQFWASPFNLNPGLAGAFDGDYRFILNQRTQWRSITVPYNTFGISADASDLNPSPLSHRPALEQLGAAVSFYTDRAGDSRLSTTQFQLALSYAIPVKTASNAAVIPGLLLGLHNTGIDYAQLNFDNQWNGLFYDPSLDTGENFARDTRTYANLGFGLVYYAQEGRRNFTEAGMALLNLNNPAQSWFDMSGINLDSRLNVHARHRRPVHKQVDIEPALLLMRQGSYREYGLGLNGYYIMEENGGLFRSVYAGVFVRARDAGYVVAGMEYDSWNAAVSYDFNTSNLRPASNGRGGFEFSIVYILRRPDLRLNLPKSCPDYL